MDVVRALVGSQRSAAITDMIKMLLRVANRPEREQNLAKDALDHLGHIRVIRDRIVHTGALPFYDKGWLFKTGNSHEVREREKAKDYVFRIEDLEDMTDDLKAIRLQLGLVTLRDSPNFHEIAPPMELSNHFSIDQFSQLLRIIHIREFANQVTRSLDRLSRQ